MYEKLKRFIENDHIFTSLVILGVGFAAFFLGRLSVGEGMMAPQAKDSVATVRLVTEPKPVPVPTSASSSTETGSVTTGQYVASKTGSKYHLTTCPGAKQIKPANAVYFTTSADAEAAGYSKALNCPGL